jgi:hypothetical protein
LSATYDTLRKLAGSVDVTLVNIARSVDQMETLRFEAANPSFLLHAAKPGAGSP